MKTKVGAQEYAAGTIVAGKYRLLHRLGQGGMGSIWAAHNPTLDINVALKLIRLDTASDDAHARLIQEARATARLADPGIVRIFDVGHTEQGDPFITMELLTGTNLRQALDGGPLEPVRAVRTLLPIVRALECAHRGGIVHRDVKPDNIVLAIGTRGDLQPKLVDFGVAKILTRPNQLTSVGAAVGSPLYMSPEQARGEPIDARTDLWSICVVLYESIMGAPPFDATNSNALLHAIATQSAPTLAGRGVCDEGLSRVIDRGLSKKRDERWQHARDLMLALAEWLRAHGATEDITGLSLRGRGLGSPSNLPRAGALDGAGSGRDARARAVAATVVNGLDPEEAEQRAASLRQAEAADDVRRAALAKTAASMAPDRRTSALLWGGLVFIGLALVIMALAFVRRETLSGTPAPAGTSPYAEPPLLLPAPQETPPATLRSGHAATSTPGDAVEAAASGSSGRSGASSVEPATSAAAGRTAREPAKVEPNRPRPKAPLAPAARRASRSPSAEKTEKTPKTSKPAPKPRAPGPFKNPFE